MAESLEARDDTKLYLTEFLGTAILVFFAAGSVMVCAMLGGLPAPLISGAASGLTLMVLIWAFGGISGAHFNPALTVALALTADFPGNRVLGYVIAQLGGSVLGAAMLYWVLGPHGGMGANLPNAGLGITALTAFAIESFLSLVMMLVIRGSLSAELPFRQFAAIPIGVIVGIEVMLMGAIAGAAMNPARAFGPYVFFGEWRFFWIYVAGPLLGIVAGGYLHNLLSRVGNRP